MPTLTSEEVPPPPVRKSSRGKENHQPNDDGSAENLSDLIDTDDDDDASVGDAPPARKKKKSTTTTKKKKKPIAKKVSSSSTKKKRVVTEKVEEEDDDRIAVLTAELEDLKERYDALEEKKNELVDTVRDLEMEAITKNASLIKEKGLAETNGKLAADATKRANDAKKVNEQLVKDHNKLKKELESAHAMALEQLRAMHVVDKANIESELTNTKSFLAKCEMELAQVKKTLDTTQKEELKFLREEKVASAKVEHNTCLLYTSPSPRDGLLSRMPSSA